VILEKSHVKSARVRQLGTILQAERPGGDGEVGMHCILCSLKGAAFPRATAQGHSAIIAVASCNRRFLQTDVVCPYIMMIS
jgi:hypothetical protein